MKRLLDSNPMGGKLKRILVPFCAYWEKKLTYSLKVILVSLIIGGKDTHFALYCKKFFTVLNFILTFEATLLAQTKLKEESLSLPS